MKGLHFLIGLFVLLSISSCDVKNLSGLNVTGKVGEILVVCDDSIWASPVKAELDTALTQFIMPYFPDVPTFELVHRNMKSFDGAIKRHRNVLFLNLDNTHKESRPIIKSRNDVWANRQLVIEVTAKNLQQLYTLCMDGLPEVHAQFDRAEWNRIRKYFGEKQSTNINERNPAKFRFAS
jgi:hypothetical protein